MPHLVRVHILTVVEKVEAAVDPDAALDELGRGVAFQHEALGGVGGVNVC